MTVRKAAAVRLLTPTFAPLLRWSLPVAATRVGCVCPLPPFQLFVSPHPETMSRGLETRAFHSQLRIDLMVGRLPRRYCAPCLLSFIANAPAMSAAHQPTSREGADGLDCRRNLSSFKYAKVSPSLKLMFLGRLPVRRSVRHSGWRNLLPIQARLRRTCFPRCLR